VKRATLFALTGVGFFVYWLVAKPTFEASPTQGDWPHVLAFTAIILTLAIAVPQFAQLVGGSIAFRSSLVVATGASLSSVANVLEDGLKLEWAFFGFVLDTAIILLGLLALTIAAVAREGQRPLGLVPAGTMAGVLLFVNAGGPVMLATWMVAAAVARAPTPRRVQAGRMTF
jgi:hypothetical protein